jgi:hypothetical protein
VDVLFFNASLVSDAVFSAIIGLVTVLAYRLCWLPIVDVLPFYIVGVRLRVLQPIERMVINID